MVADAIATKRLFDKLDEEDDPDRDLRAKLFAKIVAVMADLKGVPKSGNNSFLHFQYSTESDVMGALRPLMAKHKLVFLTSIVEVVEVPDSATEKLGPILRVEIVGTFGDAETGFTYSTKWYGYGQDMGDKAAQKAITSAVKTLLSKMFLAAAEDEDQKPEQKAATTAAPTARPAAVQPVKPVQQPYPTR